MNIPISGRELKDKTKAFLGHVAFSVIVFSVVIFVLIYFWYPPPYFTIDGGWRGLRIVAFVDIVAGPVLTFCVFKIGKKGLKLDLALILTLQLFALGYGIMTLYSYRTVSLVYVYDSIYVLGANAYADSDIDIDVLNKVEGPWPKFVYMDISSLDDNETHAYLALSKESGNYTLLSKYYETPTRFMDNIISKARDISFHLEDHPNAIAPTNEFLSEHGGKLEDYAFIPLYARYYNYHLAIHKGTKKVVGVLEVLSPFMIDIRYVSASQKIAEKKAAELKQTELVDENR